MLSSELEFCLNEAFQRARDSRHEFMTVEHLLLALLDIPRVHEILKACDSNITELRRQLTDNAMDHFLAPGVKVVIGTAHKALSMLNHQHVRALLAEGKAPFTTVIIDESGLISRTGAAALSLLAARRVLLAGDSKQLAPISRMSRLLPSSQARWSGREPIRSAGIAPCCL